MNRSYVLAIAIVVFVFSGAASAQRVGGYKDIAVTDAGVQEAAEFAASSHSEKSGKTNELISISKAEVQVVQGKNYRVCLKVNAEGQGDETNAIIFVQAVVYVDLKGNRRLTNWTVSDCGEPSDDEDGL